MSSSPSFDELYRRLLSHYGPQHWWPANDPFEVALGAVLTQGTAWTNAASAIHNLKQADAHWPEAIDRLSRADLAEIIRPAGFHNVKAGRLKALTRWWLDNNGHRGLSRLAKQDLRDGLLQVHGIGWETADAIVLYAFQKRVFVVDAYARRIFSRVGLIQGDEHYEALRAMLEQHFSGDVQGCNEYHAVIVAHAKASCRTRPLCEGCCLADMCAYPVN